jgi:hypothetical protein
MSGHQGFLLLKVADHVTVEEIEKPGDLLPPLALLACFNQGIEAPEEFLMLAIDQIDPHRVVLGPEDSHAFFSFAGAGACGRRFFGREGSAPLTALDPVVLVKGKRSPPVPRQGALPP